MPVKTITKNICSMRPRSPINDIGIEEWNYGKTILQGMNVDDVIVHSKKKWIIKDNKTELEGLLVYMLKYEYDDNDEKVLYKIIALLNKESLYDTFPLCDYINRKPSSIVSKVETVIESE